MTDKTKHSMVTTFKGRMTSLQVGILYGFMVKRISRGYSTAEMSFLMGYSTDYIRQKEELKQIGFSFEDIHNFATALEERSWRGFSYSYEEHNKEADYLLVKTLSKVRIDLQLFRIAEDQSQTLVFHLLEENPGYVRYPTSEAEYFQEAQAVMKVLFEGRLFYSAKTALEIYQRCRTISGNNNLDPKHIQAAIASFTSLKEFPKLKKIRSKEYGCMYEKVFE